MTDEEKKPECFVVMPIRAAGTPDHEHFSAVYRQGIRSPMSADLGYHCTRADEVSESGSINDDIIRRIANSEIVIADLTDTNPNVFYEIGIRHTLRRFGTILILDKGRTANIPFDLSGYRIIFYQGTLTGIEELRNAIRNFVISLQSKANESRDSLVHTVFPHLPVNVVDANQKSSEGILRAQLVEARQLIARLEKRVGITDPNSALELQDPLERLNYILSQAAALKLPQQIFDECRNCARDGKIKEFVEHVVQFCSAEEGHSPEMFTSIATLAAQVGLRHLQVAIYNRAAEIFPESTGISENRISTTLTSNAAADRERIRRELRKDWGIAVAEDGTYSVPQTFSSKNVFLFGRYSDSLRYEGKFDENFEFVGKVHQILPKDPAVLRNYAATLRDQGRREEAFGYYKKSILLGTPATNYVTAHWWAVDLENAGHFRASIQIQALGCQINLDDPDYWANLVSVISKSIVYDIEDLRDEIVKFGHDRVMNIARCAMSSSGVGVSAVRVLARSLDIDEASIYELRDKKLSFQERRAVIENVLEVFKVDYFKSCALPADQ